MRAPELDASVAAVMEDYPPPAREKLLRLRALVFETASELDDVGELTEAVKWGEPAYLTEQSKTGSTIRMGWHKARPDQCALYFHCRTTLVSDFRTWFEGQLQFEGNRAVLLPLGEPLPEDVLRACIARALRYHVDERAQSKREINAAGRRTG